MSKEDTTSPTMSTKGLMLSFMIEAMGGCDVATDDIPGDLLQTDYDKGDIHIKMKGSIVTLPEEIDPAYYKEFIYLDSRCRKCMYAESKKTICGTL